MFQTVPLTIIRSSLVYTQLWYMSLLCVRIVKTPNDGQRNCPKHVEFYSKNKFREISASGWFYYTSSRYVSVTDCKLSSAISQASGAM